MNDTCPRCGRGVIAGQAKIAVAFTMDELEDIAMMAPRPDTRARAVCAISLLDEERAQRVEVEQRSVYG